MKENLNSEKGFTLVELMVVVAIIGILSAIAIPQFSKFQAKAKTSEAKIQLSAIYSVEAAYFADSGQYSTCLASMGFAPEGARTYYSIGFEEENLGAEADRMGCVAGGMSWDANVGVGAVKGDLANHKEKGNLKVTDDSTKYMAGASGVILNAGANESDDWTIDQDKSVIHSRVGY